MFLLNLPVSTKQGVNYECQTIKMPFFLKILDFFDRHYNYAQLTGRITKDATDEYERVLKIFQWTHQFIKRPPKGFPIIDDHVWHIIIRGYGADDQLQDVFTTLCNYAGLDAFYGLISNSAQSQRKPFSFVKVDGKWVVFDAYNGTYFKDRGGEFADIERLKSGEWLAQSNNTLPKPDYAAYFNNLPSIKETAWNRANIQSPLNRLLFELKKLKRYFQLLI